MRIQIVAPPPPDLSNGNRVTALRWARIFRELGHRAFVQHTYRRQPADTLIALHAIKSLPAMVSFREHHPDQPIVVAMTGTDVYGKKTIEPSLRLAARIVALQGQAPEQIPAIHRARTRVIYQSAQAGSRQGPRKTHRFQVAVIGHLRAVKDPFRTAMAVRKLDSESNISVVHVGRALVPKMEQRARAESERNPRYRWIGGRTAGRTRTILTSSDLLVISSEVEGSSNVLGEALVSGVPVLATRIPGLEGTLGPDYPGYFPLRDTVALRTLLLRAESDPAFYHALKKSAARLAQIVSPAREKRDWHRLLRELKGLTQ